MSTLNVDKVDPSTGTALEIGSSGDTVTVPSGATFAVSGTMNASSITAGTVATARLGTGTASSSTVLYGDQTYKAEPGGITVADQWRVTSGFTGDADPISSNWEQVDTSGQGTLGSAMTESSGVFTFPSTGIYYVEFNFGISAAANSRFQYCEMHVTVNDSAYAAISEGYTWMNSPSSNSFASAAQNSLVDVTDTANVKIKFIATNYDDDNTFRGSSTYNAMWATFIRLGDT